MGPPLRVAVGIVVAAAIAAWLPQPARGLITIVAGMGGPTWSFGLLARRRLGMDDDMAWAVGAMLMLVTWSLGMLLLLLAGVHLARPVVLVLLAGALILPVRAARVRPGAHRGLV